MVIWTIAIIQFFTMETAQQVLIVFVVLGDIRMVCKLVWLKFMEHGI